MLQLMHVLYPHNISTPQEDVLQIINKDEHIFKKKLKKSKWLKIHHHGPCVVKG